LTWRIDLGPLREVGPQGSKRTDANSWCVSYRVKLNPRWVCVPHRAWSLLARQPMKPRHSA